MRNKKSIKKVLKQIEIAWNNNPDLRLCQLLSNCFLYNDLYYVEDKELIKRLRNTPIEDKDTEFKNSLMKNIKKK